MTEHSAEGGKRRDKWLWPALLVLLLAMTIVWFATPIGKIGQAPLRKPSTEWVEKPASPGVEVDLPKVELRSPVASPDPQKTPHP